MHYFGGRLCLDRIGAAHGNEEYVHGGDGFDLFLVKGRAQVAEVKYAEKLGKKGVRYLDAPVTGGQKGAEAGTLTFMVGGAGADVKRAEPVLRAMGKKIVHAGGEGFGQRLKLVNQLVCSIHLLALGESLALAKKQGLDLKKTRELLVSGAAGSWALNVYGEKIIQGDFAPGFSVKWQAKDARIAVEAAKKLGMDLPGLELARKRLEEAAAKGMGEDGTQSIYRLYDRAG